MSAVPGGGTFPVLAARVAAVTPADALAWVRACIEERRRTYVCVANVHVVVEADRDAGFAAVVNGAGLVVPDGMPLVWVGRWLGRPVARVYGPDLMLELCAEAAACGWGVYLYGGGTGVPEEVGRRLTTRWPALRVVGAESPPFRPLSDEETTAALDRIDRSGARLVFVGLGCPKQERWMADHRGRLAAEVLVGVGAAFDFHAGRIRQAPPFMRQAGMEWLFRLSREPRRLWRRYLLLNPYFIVRIAAQLLRRGRGGGGPDGR